MNYCHVIASGAKQSTSHSLSWIASLSLAMTALLTLVSCSIGDHPQIAVYTINSVTAIPQSCHVKSTLQVTEPVAGPGLDSMRIAVMQGQQRIDYYSGVKWAAPVDEMLHGVFVSSFEKSGVFASVSTEAESANPDLRLTTDIRNYEVTDSATPTIHLGIVSKLVNASNRKVLVTIPVEKTITPAENKMESIIAAFNTAGADAANEIVAKSLAALPKCRTGK